MKFILLSLISVFAVFVPSLYYADFVPLNTDMVGTFGSHVQFADYDNDNDLDLIVTGSTYYTGIGSTKLYRNNGNLEFTEVATPFVGVFHSSSAWEDYNSDGYLDLAISGLTVGTTNPVTKVYRGGANGAFNEIAYPFLGADNAWLEWGDYNNDGMPDLIVAGSNGGQNFTRLYRNNGADSFTVVNTPFANVEYGAANWVDYDLDGDLDLSISGLWVSFLYRNDGNDVFTQLNPGFVCVKSSSAAWADFDNDGYPDYVVEGTIPGGYCVTYLYRNMGDGSFQQVAYEFPGILSGSLAWGDYNNDGRLDLLISGANNYGRSTQIFRNDGNGQFTGMEDNFTPISSGWAVWGDIDNDGRLDIAYSGYTGNSYITGIYHNQSPSENTAPTAPHLSFDSLAQKLSFSFSQDTTTPIPGLTYAVRIGTSPGASDVIAPCSNSDGYRRIARKGHSSVKFLAVAGITYYASAQAIDQGFMGSAFGPEICFPISATAELEILSSNPINFGSWYNNYLSSPQEVILHNSGEADLVIDSLAFANNPSVFVLDEANPPLPLICPPDSVVTLQVMFLPTSTDIYSELLTIYSNASNLPAAVIRLNGRSIPAPPAAVSHFMVEMSGYDAVLSWDAVATDILGGDFVPDTYVIAFSQVPDNYFWFLAETTETEYVHYGVARYSPMMFYKVKAVKYNRKEDAAKFETLIGQKRPIKWSEIEELLSR